LPKELRQKIDAGNKKVLRANKGDVARSKAAIQSHMWETRDADWVELEGEREGEAEQKKKQQQQQQRNGSVEQRRR
jgi:hypothetical protein